MFHPITGVFFFSLLIVVCVSIPKKGIFYWHTSTSFVIDCANKCVHNLNCKWIHGASNPCLWEYKRLSVKYGNTSRELSQKMKYPVEKNATFMLGVVPAQQKQPLSGTQEWREKKEAAQKHEHGEERQRHVLTVIWSNGYCQNVHLHKMVINDIITWSHYGSCPPLCVRWFMQTLHSIWNCVWLWMKV